MPEAAGRMDFAGGQGIFRATIWTDQPEVLGLWVVVESWLFSEWLFICSYAREGGGDCDRHNDGFCRVGETVTDKETERERLKHRQAQRQRQGRRQS